MLDQLRHVNLRCVINLYLSDSESTFPGYCSSLVFKGHSFVQIATHNLKDRVEAKYSQVFLSLGSYFCIKAFCTRQNFCNGNSITWRSFTTQTHIICNIYELIFLLFLGTLFQLYCSISFQYAFQYNCNVIEKLQSYKQHDACKFLSEHFYMTVFELHKFLQLDVNL